MLNDESLIDRVLCGHAEDYRELMQRYQGRVYRLAWGILNSRDEAEDAVQDAFLKAYGRLSSCRDRCKLWPWLRRIAFNVCMDRLSARNPEESLDEYAGSERSECGDLEAEVIRKMQAGRIREIVSALPAAYRTVIVLRYEEELSYKEIAELLDEPVTSIQVRIHRAKRMLAEELGVVLDEVH